jgi:hypothetical protein
VLCDRHTKSFPANLPNPFVKGFTIMLKHIPFFGTLAGFGFLLGVISGTIVETLM